MTTIAVLLLFLLLTLGGLAFLKKPGQQHPRRQPIPQDVLPDTFVVLDIETTGLKAGAHEIIEVAAIRFTKGSTDHDAYQALVKPSKPIPARITELTGITQARLDAEGRAHDDVLREFWDFLGQGRLVAYNADFDLAFLHAAAERAGLPPLQNPVSCALKMARRAWPGRKSFKLDAIAADLEIAEQQAHRAIEDARRALIVYAAATAKLRAIE